MEIIKPIFIVGTGRSGTTVFYRTLIQHEILLSFTNWDAGMPRLFKIGFVPLIEKFKLTRNFFKKFKKLEPSKEMKGILAYSKISRKPLPLSANDVQPEEEQRLKKLIKRCIKFHKGERFVGKNTTNGLRLEYLNKIFPDAFFIHIVRDGRANIHSFLEVDWFPEIKFWWSEGKLYEDLIQGGKYPEELAALHWKYNTEEVIRQSKSIAKDRYCEIKYEDYTENPWNTFKKVCEFCQLEWTNHFQDIVKNTKFENRNYKWKENLTDKQIERIENIIHNLLARFNYI